MRILFPIFLIVILSQTVAAQKVAVVMSGGAAKGLAHVGMLKALEENEIPIDFVTGTSMGGIVAGCYAAGMSPAHIEEMMLSEDLLRWVNGQMEPGHNYFYTKDDVRPSFVRLNLLLDSTFNLNFNASLASDISLNFAIAEKMAQPSAIANGNFDSLFVPLRVVAAEIFTQREVVLKSGSLGDALRATQTVPFFYTPIRIDGKYLFDGGVYNNFPVDVAEKEFRPDVIIGSNVASKVYEEYPSGEDDKLLSGSLMYLLLDKSNPGAVPASGIYLQPNLKGITGFDFYKAKAIIDSGYAETMRRMPDIKKKIALRKTCEEVALARNAFNSKTSPLLVEKVKFDGLTSNQEAYLGRFFNRGKRPLFFSDIKSGYYRIVSEDYFKSLYPSFKFDSASRHFNFLLSKRPQNNFQVDFGGVIATRNISNIYLGLNYYYFNRILTHASANFYTGGFYQSAQLKARLDFSRRFYAEPEALFNSWNFVEGNDIIVKKENSTILKRIDRKVGMGFGIPIGKQFKLLLEGFYISNKDEYINTDVLKSTDTLDVLTLTGGHYSLNVSTSNLNRKQYASDGKSYYFGVDWFDLLETITPGSTSSIAAPIVENKGRHWIRGTVLMEQYFRKGIYSSGYLLHATFSDQPLFANYQGTIINAPGFYPMQDSRTLMLQHFRSFNFVAGGWRNVFAIRKKLDFRLEGYLFKPLESIVQGAGQEPELKDELTRVFFAATAGLVLHSTVGPISLSVNYYDDKKTQLGVLLHIGFLLFNKPSLE